MKRPPTPRPEPYRLYWHFAAERQKAFTRRVAGETGPWTDDPILQEFKFCNTYRASDRVSQYMIRDVCYHDENCDDADRIFQIIAFRTFSNIATWRSVRGHLGRYPVLEDLRSGAFTKALDATKVTNSRLYTGAFILCATDAYGQSLKHLNHVALFRHMMLDDDFGSQLQECTSLGAVYDAILAYPLMGAFMAYQTAIDLNYSPLVNFSENDFTQPGPGALRGMKKVFSDPGDYKPAEIILWMVENQDREFSRLGIDFDGLWSRPLHAIDCQSLFCETDKYCRQALPDLTSARKRIKAKFNATPEPIHLFYPPKWGINHLLPQQAVFGAAPADARLSEPVTLF